MSLTKKKFIVFKITLKAYANCEISWFNTTSTQIWCVRSDNEKSNSLFEIDIAFTLMLWKNIELMHDNRSKCENDRKINVVFDIVNVETFCVAHNFCLLKISFNLFIVSIENLTENRSNEKSLSKRTSSINRTRNSAT